MERIYGHVLYIAKRTPVTSADDEIDDEKAIDDCKFMRDH